MGHNLASLQGLLQKGPVSPSAPNPGTHNPHLTVSQKAFMGYNTASLQGSLQKGPTPPSGGNPGTQVHSSFNNWPNPFVWLANWPKGFVPPYYTVSPSAPNPGTHNLI
jgi:hypothetical protein